MRSWHESWFVQVFLLAEMVVEFWATLGVEIHVEILRGNVTLICIINTDILFIIWFINDHCIIQERVIVYITYGIFI